jgi:3-(3-hydroxy-phenyl)propionate hydroxylase
MAQVYQHPVFPFEPPPELREGRVGSTPVAVVGAGPVGLAVAIDLAARGIDVVLVDDDETVSHGSRLICISKRTLEIFDRLGAGAGFAEKGVVWNKGRLFFGDDEVYSFDLLKEDGHQWPAFVNIQQYYAEDFLVRVAERLPNLDIRWKSAVVGVAQSDDHVSVSVDTPEGQYDLDAQYVIACDGAASFVRRSLGLDFEGRAFQDRFLITDVTMEADFPSERWFWFEPPFHEGQSALLHKQPDSVWRIDLQLDQSADPEIEGREENVRPRIERMLGADAKFEIDWISLYTFRCRRLQRFTEGRIFFAGDCAHQVSPFGARGGNGGVQDADNLAWKLAAVLNGQAPPALLESYDAERIPASDENILNSSRSTDFMTPKTYAVRDIRDAVLALAQDHGFARRMVNSGRLSVPAVLDGSPLNTPDTDAFDSPMRPGASALDAPLETADGKGWFLHQLGADFTVMLYLAAATDALPVGWPGVEGDLIKALVVAPEAPDGGVGDAAGDLRARYDLEPGTAYLFRPDQHIAARTRTFSLAWLNEALARALGCA